MSDTVESFLDKLKETPRDWYLLDGVIWRGNPRSKPSNADCDCPLTAVYGLKRRDWPLDRVLIDWIGLISGSPESLINGSQSPYKEIGLVLRRLLLAACGLKEQVSN